ncbi:MAG TPA: type II secretion system protein [Terriglobales bacterium]|nr:type II secretion system protein [Terriglobales bacterium]
MVQWFKLTAKANNTEQADSVQIQARKAFSLEMPKRNKQQGFTLVELIVATSILLILSTMAVPLARVTIKREREKELRAGLWQLRDAIDRYKDAADRGAFQIKVGSEGYPPDLDTLVNGVDVGGKKLKFLRRIPTDPMTGGTDWGLRSMQDDPDSDSWGGDNVFDVYTKSDGTALDGTKYKDW